MEKTTQKTQKTGETLRVTPTGEEWDNTQTIAEQVKAERRELSRLMNIHVRQNTPLEQVCKTADLMNTIRQAFAVTGEDRLTFRLAKTATATIESNAIGKGIYALYLSAKEKQKQNLLPMAEYANLTKTGVKLVRLSVEFKRG